MMYGILVYTTTAVRLVSVHLLCQPRHREVRPPSVNPENCWKFGTISTRGFSMTLNPNALFPNLLLLYTHFS